MLLFIDKLTIWLPCAKYEKNEVLIPYYF